MHIDIGVTENCKNPDSYGMICVWCNECGRFDNEPLPTEEDNESPVKELMRITRKGRANEVD